MTTQLPLDFSCPSCHQILTAPPELFGQAIVCPSCSTDLIVPSEEASAELPQQPPALWNPLAAVIWSFPLTPVFGSTLLFLNARALGREKEAHEHLGWALAAVVVHIGAIVAGRIDHDSMFKYAGLVLLVVWYYSVASKQVALVKEAYGKSYPRKAWKQPIVGGMVGVVALGLILGNFHGFLDADSRRGAGKSSLLGSLLPGGSAPSISSVYEKSGEEAVEAAAHYVEDVWTFTEVDDSGSSHWFKFEIKSGGELVFYTAEAIDDDWGDPNPLSWEIISGKFSDSGKRFYEVKMRGNSHWLVGAMRILIERDGRLTLRIDTDEPRTLKRGDAFPFSQ